MRALVNWLMVLVIVAASTVSAFAGPSSDETFSKAQGTKKSTAPFPSQI